MSTRQPTYTELSAAILNSYLEKGYTLFVRYQIGHDAAEVTTFRVAFYKRKEEAQLIYDLVRFQNKFMGHIIDDEAMEMAEGVDQCRFLVRDVGFEKGGKNIN